MPDALYSSTVAILNFVDGEIIDRSPVAGAFSSVNGAALVSGSPNVLRLDGVNDYVLGPSGASYSFTGQFCIEIVCKKPAIGAGNYDTALTTDTSNGSAANGWSFELGTARGPTFVANGGSLLLSSSATINDGEVHHWCVRRGPDSIVSIAKDGVQIAAGVYGSTIASNGFLGVGRNAALTAYPFLGDILAVRITNGSARYLGTSFAPDSAPFFYPAYAISGTVRDANNVLAARLVRAYREDTGALIGATTSDETTGAYSIRTGHDGPCTLNFYPAASESLPALVLRGVVPV